MAKEASPRFSIFEQIQAVESAVNGLSYERKALEAVVLTLGVFAQDPDAYRAYAKRLRETKRDPAVKAVLETFQNEGAYIAEINDR